MGDLNELLALVKAATGPDRNLDAMLHHWALDGVGTGAYSDSPAYTASIDAALALTERMLGHGATVDLHINIGAAEHSCILRLYERHEEPVVAEGLRGPPLAILAALLSAMIEQEKP